MKNFRSRVPSGGLYPSADFDAVLERANALSEYQKQQKQIKTIYGGYGGPGPSSTQKLNIRLRLNLAPSNIPPQTGSLSAKARKSLGKGLPARPYQSNSGRTTQTSKSKREGEEIPKRSSSGVMKGPRAKGEPFVEKVIPRQASNPDLPMRQYNLHLQPAESADFLYFQKP